MLAALRCPECTAPVRTLPREGEAAACAYCGAALSFGAPPEVRTEEHFTLVLRVGPSNIDRMVRVLVDHLHVDPVDARARLAEPPTTFALGPGEEHAHALAGTASEAGAQVEVISRKVAIPLRTVTLESAGAKSIAVVVALRAEIDLSVVEAKQLARGTPCVIATNVPEPEARALVAALEGAGAKASAR